MKHTARLKHLLAAGGAISRGATFREEAASANAATNAAANAGATHNTSKNDDFNSLAKQVISSANYDIDNMSLDTLSFDGGDAEESSSSSGQAAADAAAAGGSLPRCFCCSVRGVDCLPICKCEYEWFQTHGVWPFPSDNPQAAYNTKEINIK